MTETPPPVIEEGIAIAKARTSAARGRLVSSLLRLKNSVMPGALARKLVHAATDKAADAADAGAQAVRARPAVAAGVAALAALFLARKPIARAISSDPPETPSARARSPVKRSRKAKP